MVLQQLRHGITGNAKTFLRTLQERWVLQNGRPARKPAIFLPLDGQLSSITWQGKKLRFLRVIWNATMA
jgi:hypothetical protein